MDMNAGRESPRQGHGNIFQRAPFHVREPSRATVFHESAVRRRGDSNQIGPRFRLSFSETTKAVPERSQVFLTDESKLLLLDRIQPDPWHPSFPWGVRREPFYIPAPPVYL